MKSYMTNQRSLLGLTLVLNVLQSLLVIGIALILNLLIDQINSHEIAFRTTLLICGGYTLVLGSVIFLRAFVEATWLKKIITEIKDNLLRGILEKDVIEFQKKNSGDYLSLITANVTMIEEHYFKNILKMFASFITVLFATIALFSINWLVAVVSISLSLIPSLTPMIFKQSMSRKQADISLANGKYNSDVKDYFNGFETIKSYQLQKIIIAKHQKSAVHLEKNKSQLSILMGKLLGASNFTASGVQFSIILFAGYLTINGQMTLGGTIAVTQLAGQAIAPVIEMSNQIAALKSVKGVAQELEGIMETKQISNHKQPVKFTDTLTLKNINLKYEEKIALQQINWDIQKGLKYVIVGESGSGKSTMLKLLQNYFSDYQGEILVDQVEYKDIDENSINHLITILDQSIFLFDDSIEANISLYSSVNQEKITKVIEMTGLTKMIASKEKGLKTLIKEGGRLLSGGERQRIAIARALYKGSQLLLLDEATSALDNQTAREIEDMLINLPDTTAIVVTHRLDQEMLKAYDEIIVMAAGEIVEQGSFEKLVRKQGAFNQLYQLEK
ncbi:ABC transporter ATP-binding protein [Vagococcus salmoninarum]|uniref:ABC transporter ATP-binding protein n=1 Tax=Vagococcus salmoninarum TaxID=2739 RepID=UPI00187F8826|nr:ABC transporter ATP-binding protein [Vagococcus salmoninarum]MBE9389968.1 ABC transporter ATP-binding protein [Vagococcus salmoninarum]